MNTQPIASKRAAKSSWKRVGWIALCAVTMAFAGGRIGVGLKYQAWEREHAKKMRAAMELKSAAEQKFAQKANSIPMASNFTGVKQVLSPLRRLTTRETFRYSARGEQCAAYDDVETGWSFVLIFQDGRFAGYRMAEPKVSREETEWSAAALGFEGFWKSVAMMAMILWPLVPPWIYITGRSPRRGGKIMLRLAMGPILWAASTPALYSMGWRSAGSDFRFAVIGSTVMILGGLAMLFLPDRKIPEPLKVSSGAQKDQTAEALDRMISLKKLGKEENDGVGSDGV
jgi:hypothetical protein